MRKLLLAILLFAGFISCKKDFNQSSTSIAAYHMDDLSFTTTAQQFGVLVNAAYPNTSPSAGDSYLGLDDTTELKIDSVYGAKNIRLQINHDAWQNTTQRNKFLTFFKSLYDKGFAPALNVNWKPGGSQVNFADSNQYASFLTEVLDSIAGRSNAGDTMRPNIVVVENEELNTGYYADTTTAQLKMYLGLVRLTTPICYNRGIKITDGGIVCFTNLALTWDWLKTKYDTSVANTWARKVLPPAGVPALNAGVYNSNITLGKYLVSNLALIPHLSFFNLHWYEPVFARYWPESGISPYDPPYNKSQDAVVAGGMDSVVKYYNTNYTALKLITNETGQVTYSSSLTNSMVSMYKSFKANGNNFSIAVWYDGDGDYSKVIGGAKALHNALSTTSYSLRSSGTKFKSLMH